MVLFVEIRAMNIKQWIALLMLYVGYLLVGAIVFYYLERGHEIVKRNEDFKLYKDLLVVLKSCGLNETTTLSLEGYCGRPLTENATIDDVSQEYWSFFKSVFFVLTVVSTVGYGNIHPTMPLTRYLMMVYAVIGLPINGILLTSLASFFSTVFIRAHKKYKRYESRFGLTVDILTYLIPGILFFIFIPATAFYYFEDWSYEESVYFAFVTLTTIGFGDYVAGQKNYKNFNRELVMIYKTLLLGWIIFGLGYLIMLLGYLTRAMRSKKVVKLEHKFVEALTRSKIWHGFTKDIGYLRRVMNELYLDKFKPVFRDEHLRFHRKHTYRRSKSLPNIIFGVDDEIQFDESKASNRKRTRSEFVAPCREGISRVFSESDVHRIDRYATFASATVIRPSELLRQVVGAMEDSILRRQDEPMGVNVFSDDEILQSEKSYQKKANSFSSLYHPSSYESIVAIKRKRERALSEIPFPRSNPPTITASTNLGGTEWTWSGTGANKIFDIINERHKNQLSRNLKNRSPHLSTSFLATGAKWLNPLRKKKRFYSESQDVSSSKISISQYPEIKFLDSGKSSGKLSFEDLRKTSLQDSGTLKYRSDMSYMTHTAGTGTQGLGLMHGMMNLNGPEHSFTLHNPEDLFNKGRLLDETSLGDFLRALTALHNRVGRSQVSDEFNSRWNFSGNHTPHPQSHSLIDLSPIKETPLPKFSKFKTQISRTESMPIPNEITDKEPSNLKRLGRFLLRSYSPKSESTPDVSLAPSEKHKKLLLDPTEAYAPLDHNPSVRIQIETPSKSSSDNDIGEVGIIRSSTMDSSMGVKKNWSAGVDMNPFRTSTSTESIYMPSEGQKPPWTRQTSLKWRHNGKSQDSHKKPNSNENSLLPTIESTSKQTTGKITRSDTSFFSSSTTLMIVGGSTETLERNYNDCGSVVYRNRNCT